MANNTTTEKASKLESGYDLPVYGVENNTFYAIHIPAIICIVASFVCVLIAITLSFKRLSARTFFTGWNKSDRFIVYLAVCDGLFNIAHFTDHLHIVIIKDHVRPKELCEFYGFTLAMFILAQNLMVNVVAINAFMLMYFNKNIHFGKYDWKLLAWTFGAPFVGATINGIAGQLGPNGTFCYFDGVKGQIAFICFCTAPLLLIIVMNSILYILTFKKIYTQSSQIRKTMGRMPASMKAAHRAARAWSLFVVAFFIQWWGMGLLALWALFEDTIPQAIHHFATTFSNIGGILNLIIYTLIRKKYTQRGQAAESSATGTSSVSFTATAAPTREKSGPI